MGADKKIDEILKYLGISAKAFAESLGYERPQIIYDIQKGKTKRISEDLSIKIVSVYKSINKVWLLTGEGEMLNADEGSTMQNSEAEQAISGDNNTQIAGNANHVSHVNSSATFDKALEEIAAQRRIVEKSQEQIDRLLSIIERMSRN